MKHLLAYLSYALLSMSAGLLIAAELQGTSVFIGFLYAQVLFTSCILAHEILSSRFWQRTTKWQLKALARQQIQMEREFRNLRNETRSILKMLTVRKTPGGPSFVKQTSNQRSNVFPIRVQDEQRPINYDDNGDVWYQADTPASARQSEEWYEQQVQKRKRKAATAEGTHKPALVKKDEHNRTQINYDYENIISQSQALRYAQDTTLKEIKNALRNKDLLTSIQPIVNLKTMGAAHYECFTNILSDNDDVIPPKNYLQKAKEAGLLPSIDSIILTQSLENIIADAKKIPSNWRHIFFNVSLETFQAEEVFHKIEQFFRAHPSFNKRVVFEVSHADFAHQPNLFRPYLKRLQKFGANISFDNVTTFANMQPHLLSPYNVRFVKVSADTLKQELSRSIRDPHHPQNIKVLLDNAGINLIVEKVEAKGQLQMLRDLKIQLAQGYLFGFPTPIEEVSESGFPELEHIKLQRAV